MKQNPRIREAPHWARAAGLAACLLAIAACQPDKVARPEAAEPAAAGPGAFRPIASPEQLAGLAAGLDDAVRRLAPTLDDHRGAALLRLQLRDLAARMEAGDAANARRALANARAVLDRAGGVGASESVAGSAIRLVLDHAEALLDGPDAMQARERSRFIGDQDSTGSARAAQHQER